MCYCRTVAEAQSESILRGLFMKNAITLSVVVLLGFAGVAYCETYSMDTYYPSPVGVYSNVTVTSSTLLARDGGTVSVGENSGTAKLNVKGEATITGNAKIGGVVIPGSFSSDPTDAASQVEGAIYFNSSTKSHRVYRNASWGELSGGSVELYSAHETGCIESLEGKKGINIVPGVSINNFAIQMLDNRSTGEAWQGYLKIVTCRKVKISPQSPSGWKWE